MSTSLSMVRKLIRRGPPVIIPVILTVVALTCARPPAGRKGRPPVKDLWPTVILVSIDGFRPDYLDRYPAPVIRLIAGQGVRARWMTPCYPTLTFPNHYCMATGLYAEGHGIVGNNVYDPGFKQSFGMGKREEVWNGRWWLGEPIWVTAEKQGRRTGAFFFPGTEAEIGGRRPSYWRPYDEKVPNSERIATVLSWLDLPAAERPSLILTYFSDVDQAGHEAGPDSDVVGRAVAEADRAMGELVGGLQARRLSDQVNLIVVSDHGMATLLPGHAIALDDYFDPSLAEAVSWNGELVNIFPKPGLKEAIYSSLKSHAPPQVKIYSREEVPARFHYSTSPRIGEIVVMADEGWVVVSRGRQRLQGLAAAVGGGNRGAHGYDNQLESMRALFIARGPAFKRAEVVNPIKNVDVYNVIAKILGLEPARNQGDAAAARAVLR